MKFSLAALAGLATIAQAATYPSCSAVPSNCHVNDNGGSLPNLVCHRPGTVTAPAYMSTCIADDSDSCVNQCYQTAGCKTIAYGGNGHPRLCTLYSKKPSAMGFASGSSNAPVFSNINCFFESCQGGGAAGRLA